MRIKESLSRRVYLVCNYIFVGVLAAVSCLQGSLKAMDQQGKAPKQKGPPPVNFNQH